MRGLEFNPGVPNLLASGAGESEILITDLSNPATPSVYSPGARSNAPPADISCVTWNRKVQHILASTSHNGQSVVWDLKLKKPVISFTDPNNKTQRNSVIEWSPDVVSCWVVCPGVGVCCIFPREACNVYWKGGVGRRCEGVRWRGSCECSPRKWLSLAPLTTPCEDAPLPSSLPSNPLLCSPPSLPLTQSPTFSAFLLFHAPDSPLPRSPSFPPAHHVTIPPSVTGNSSAHRL